jgi:hypothetical protein
MTFNPNADSALSPLSWTLYQIVRHVVDRRNKRASGINNFSRNTSSNYTINVAIKHVNR